MKKQILLFLLVVSIAAAKAQTTKYYVFPDSNAYWGGENESNNGFNLTVVDYGITQSGDTVVNGKSYHKLYQGGSMSSSGSNSYYNFYGAYREDTTARKVYMYNPVSGNDSLLYDFNVKVGDSIGHPKPLYSGTDYVKSIDSIMIFGYYRKRINVTNTKDTNMTIMSVIEGIGGTDGPFGTELLPPPFESFSSVLCFRYNTDTIQLSHGYFSYNCIVFGPLGVNNIEPAVQEFSVYPNPASISLGINYKLQPGYNAATLKLYNPVGQLIKTESIKYNNGALKESVTSLPNGIYYYTLSINGTVEATSKLVVIH